MQRLQPVQTVHVTSPAGTDLSFSVEARDFFTDTKIDWKTMKWMNLPVGEVIVAPVENSLTGTLVCREAVGGIGIIRDKVVIEAKKGRAVDVSSQNKRVLGRVKQALATDDWSSIVGEFAFGINPKARMCDQFLETEKIKGSCHVAFGNNSDFPGGRNPSRNHMDFLISKPTVNAVTDEGETIRVLSSGRFRL
jgi:leucyl aminopeptidase (aminopeptidase T)